MPAIRIPGSGGKMRIPRLIHYVVYLAVLSLFQALVAAVITKFEGSGEFEFEDLLGIAAMAVPYVVCQIVVAALTIRFLSLRKLFCLTVIFIIAEYLLCLIPFKISGEITRWVIPRFFGSLLLWPLLPLMIPVLFLALAERRRSTHVSKADRKDIPVIGSNSRDLKKVHEKHIEESENLPKRPWYFWDIGLAVIPLLFGILLDPFGIAEYLTGLFNMPLLSIILFGSLPLVPVVLVCLVWLLVRMFLIWPRRIHVWFRLLLCWVAVIASLTVFISPLFIRITPPRYEMFTRGFRNYVRIRTDFEAIQTWLGTLDPNDCEGQPLNMKIAPGVELMDVPKTIPEPKAIARLKPRYTNLSLDSSGHPMIRLTWGSGMIGSWGLVVGDENLEIPVTELPGWKEYRHGNKTDRLYERGEYRLPVALGAYVWHEIE